jgi:hypothetical protein
LYYLQSRYYSPDWGRFINADTITGSTGELLTSNMFAYCRNNPVNHADPDGDWVVDVIFLVADIGKAIAHPSASSVGWILLDVISFADPTGAGSTAAHALKAAHAMEVTVHAVKETSHAVNIVKKGSLNPVVKEAASFGRKMHKEYDYGKGVKKEVALPSKKRMDGYDRNNKIIYELKPNNPRARKQGLKQLQGYIEEANKVHGYGHRGVLKTYER